MDHKLYIVLNKADQFRKVSAPIEIQVDLQTHTPQQQQQHVPPSFPHTPVNNHTTKQIHDFARAYGSLCWNLSKVIPRKDLPRIYTMCLPVQYQKRGDHLSLNQPAGAGDGEASSLGQGLVDLERSRDEVVGEVRKAPKRRIDNVITRLADSVHVVQMHARVLEALRADYARQLWTYRAGAAGLATAGAGLVAGAAYLGLAMQPLLAFAALYTVGSGGFLYYNGKILGEHEAALASPEGLRRVFERLYARQVLEGDAFVTSLWKRTYQALQMVVDTQGGLARLPRATNAELRELERILEEDVPALRRLAAPVTWTFKSGAGGGVGGGSGGPRPITGVARSFANMIGGGTAGGSDSGSQGDGEGRRVTGEASNVPYRTLGGPGMTAGATTPPSPAVNATASSYTSWKVD